jgi:hypothetical protein
MNKQTIITILFALVAMVGQAQVKCHVEGTLETDAWGDDIIICEAGTDLRVVDDPRFHVKAKEGRFAYDIETDFPRLYNIFFLDTIERNRVGCNLLNGSIISFSRAIRMFFVMPQCFVCRFLVIYPFLIEIQQNLPCRLKNYSQTEKSHIT